eukprot:4434109-Prymnesium_polylepis.2
MAISWAIDSPRRPVVYLACRSCPVFKTCPDTKGAARVRLTRARSAADVGALRLDAERVVDVAQLLEDIDLPERDPKVDLEARLIRPWPQVERGLPVVRGHRPRSNGSRGDLLLLGPLERPGWFAPARTAKVAPLDRSRLLVVGTSSYTLAV